MTGDQKNGFFTSFFRFFPDALRAPQSQGYDWQFDSEIKIFLKIYQDRVGWERGSISPNF